VATTRVQIVASPDEVFAVLADPPHRLVLRARTRPLATAEIRLPLTACDQDTEVTMIETAGDPLSRLVFNPITDPLAHVRSVESLRRLRRIVESRTSR
jgi:hypothetical protein